MFYPEACLVRALFLRLREAGELLCGTRAQYPRTSGAGGDPSMDPEFELWQGSPRETLFSIVPVPRPDEDSFDAEHPEIPSRDDPC